MRGVGWASSREIQIQFQIQIILGRRSLACVISSSFRARERYLERGKLEKLQDPFRRFGYAFHRLGFLPDAYKYLGLSIKLKEIGEMVRNL